MKKGMTLLWTILILISVFSMAAADEFRALPIDLSGGAPLQAKFDQNVTVYEDPTIRVEYYRVDSPRTEWNITYYYAMITLKDASQLRTAAADNQSFTSRAKAPAATIARRVNAVLAINGDYSGSDFGGKEDNLILRQGTIYRDAISDALDLLLIDEKGDFHVLPRNAENRNMDPTTIDDMRVINAFQFGPALVIGGEKVADEELNDESHSPAHAKPAEKAQRMCIAQIGPLQYMVLCCKWGMSLPTLRDLAMSLADCQTVYTLDGGNSTQMIFMGTKVNNVKNDGQNIRPITDIIYFASAWFR